MGSRSRTSVVGVIVSVLVLAGLFGAVPGSTPPPTAASVAGGGAVVSEPVALPAGAAQPDQPAGVDVDRVVETVQHHVHEGATPGVLQADDRLYRATFEPAGFGVTLRQKSEPESGSESKSGVGERSIRAGRDLDPGERLSGRRPSRLAAPAPFQAEEAFKLSLAGVYSGTSPWDLDRPAWQGVENRAERTVAPGLLERVTARNDELEWDLVLARPPSAAGDLRVEATVAASGPPILVADDGDAPTRSPSRAWRWPAGDGRAVKVGELVVVDAAGKELYRALPSVKGTTLSMTVPAPVLEGARYPLTLDPEVSPEYPVSDPVYPSERQDQPTVAVDGTANNESYLVVWTDDRSGAGTDIYGARVSKAGTVLDASGIAISTVQPPDGPVVPAPDDQYRPAVAFDGSSNFLVVWTDRRTTSSSGTDIYGARVSNAGNVLDPSGIAISTVQIMPNGPVVPAPGDQYRPAVAFDGSSNFLVVWTDRRTTSSSGTDIYGARVSNAGNVLEPSGIAISTVQIMPNGLVVPAPGDQYRPAVAFDGSDNFLVVWTDRRSSPPEVESDYALIDVALTDIYGARVSNAGNVLDPSGISISTVQIMPNGPVVPAPDAQYRPAVAFDRSNNFLVVWTDERDWATTGSSDIYGALVSKTGTVLHPSGIAISTAADWQYEPAVAFDSSNNFLVVWTDERDWATTGSSDIYGALVSKTGTVLHPSGIAISTAADWQYEPAVAFDDTNGGNFLVVWTDERPFSPSGPPDIYGVFVDTSGTVDTAEIALSIAEANRQHSPAVAFDGTVFLVVWTDYRSSPGGDIYGARVSVSGDLLDEAGIAVSTAPSGEHQPAVAFGDGSFLIVWVEGSNGRAVYGARVDTQGQVLEGSGTAISAMAHHPESPSVAFDYSANRFFVAWTDYRSFIDADVYGSWVSNGKRVDESDLAVSTEGSDQQSSAVVFDGNDFLVVWTDYRSSTGSPATSGADIYGAKVSRNGGAESGFPISAAPNDQYDPAVAFDGTNFLVVWTDKRSFSSSSSTGFDIYGARLNKTGIPEAAFAISTESFGQYQPGVAFNGTNFLVVWTDYRLSSASLDIYGTRVSTAGSVLDGGGFAIASSSNHEQEPSMPSYGAVGAFSFFAVGYSRNASERELRANRAFLRIVKDDATGPEAPSLVSPTADATVVDPTPPFDWSDVASAASYQLQVDDSGSSFPSRVVDVAPAASNYTPAEPLPVATYRWRVRAIDYVGAPGPWSNVFQFDVVRPTLTITKAGAGTGTVSSSDDRISCGTDCIEEYSYDTAVTLTATPDAGSVFSGWSGPCSGSATTCALTMDQNHTVGATFASSSSQTSSPPTSMSPTSSPPTSTTDTSSPPTSTTDTSSPPNSTTETSSPPNSTTETSSLPSSTTETTSTTDTSAPPDTTGSRSTTREEPARLDEATAVPRRSGNGYWLVASDGGIFAFGDARFLGSTGALTLNRPIVGMAPTPSGNGYWLVASDGGIFAFGDARFFGSTGAIALNRPIVGMAPTPSGNGYWLVASDGGIFAFGDARFLGSTGALTLNKPIVSMAPTPSGNGYWLVASDGGIFAFGDALFRGSTGALTLSRPIVGMAPTPSGSGYWLLGSDGGIFAFGDAVFRGSTGALKLVRPIVGMARTLSGSGYWLLGSDGGIFAFGDARFLGSTGAMSLNKPIVSLGRL